MLQADRAHGSLGGISHGWAAGTGLTLLPVVVIHGTRHIAGATNLVLRREHTSCAKEEGCCGRRPKGEVERAIGADSDSCRNRCAGIVV
jgi:hypothetical protein